MITIQWADAARTALHFVFEGGWSLDDLLDALDAGADVAQRHARTLHIVVDLTASGVPQVLGGAAAGSAQQAWSRLAQHAQAAGRTPGQLVVVAPNPVVRQVVNSVLAVGNPFANAMRVVPSLEAAHAHLGTQPPPPSPEGPR